MKLLKRASLGLLLLLAVTATGLMLWEPMSVATGTAPQKRDYDVQIVRDKFGVPHINGKTDADAAYGLAYAHSEDDFDTIQEVIAMTRGRSAAMLGKDAAPIDYVEGLLGSRDTVARKYSQIPADVRAVLDGYAAGVNRYAAKNPDEVRLSKLFPINGQDVATGFVLRSPFFYGLDSTIKKLTKGEAADNEPVAELRGNGAKQAMLTPIGRDPSMNGSNAFAVAPKRMADGKTWLISNAHQPYEGGVAWYEAVVHSGEGLDMAGALFPGSPFVLLGHNRNLGWTNTVNEPDLIDVYKLKLNAAGDQYQYDGKWIPLQEKRVWLRVKYGPFVLPIPKMAYRSIHGPVIINDKGAFAIRYAGIDNVKLIEQYFRIQKAQNHDQWIAAMKLRGISATNFIYADKTGRIGYYYNALFPDRKPGFNYLKTLPGDTSASMWAGPLPWEATPMIENPASGFVTNANNTPFLAAGKGSELDSGKFSPLLGIEARKTNRIVRALELLEADTSYTVDELLKIKFDTVYNRKSFAGAWIAKLLAVDVKSEPDLVAAQALLKQWDFNSDGAGKADALGEAMMHMANSANYHGEPLPDAKAKLREVVDAMMKGFGRIDPALGDVQRLIRGNVNLPAQGGTDTLRAATIWEPQDNGTMRVRHGDSFIMLTSWDKAGKVSSQSVQPYGAATTRPNSPHYTDQMEMFVAGKFKPVHFEWAEAIAASGAASGGKPYRP